MSSHDIGPDDSPRRSAWSAPRERVMIQFMHWTIILVVVIGVIALRLHSDLSDASATALLGTVLGHAGTAASQKLSSRGGDNAGG